MKFKRLGFICASLLVLACGSDPLTTGDSPAAGIETPASSPAANPPSGNDVGCSKNMTTEQLGSGRLTVDGEDLVLHFENLSTSGGMLSANVLVDSPDGLVSTAARELGRFGAGEKSLFRLSRADVSGLDLPGQEWTDARVNFEYHLDDGRIGGDQAAIFTEYGKESLARPVMSSGNARGLIEFEVPEKVTVKAGETFKVCFDHVISYPAAEPRNIDYFKASGSYTVPAYAIFVKGTVGSTNHFVYASAVDGCATFPRTAGSWTFTLTLDSMNFPPNVNEFYVSAMRDSGSFPTKQIGPYTVTSSTTDLGRKSFTMATGDDALLQHMFVIAQHTIKRAMSLGTVVKPNSVLTLKFTTGGSNYDHATRTVLINRNAAQLRGATSHEVGHWIHRSWMTTTLTLANRDDTYCTPGGTPTCTVPPNDGCARTPEGRHGQEMIEWDSVAHLEGIADFFHVLAFNKTVEESPNGGANCIFPSWASNATERMYNCDAVGLYMKTGATGGANCYEWTRSIFGNVGNELDWTKMYWDLAADEVSLGSSRLRDYLTYEEAATGWAKGNHSARLLAAMGTSSMNSAFRRAAVGNIWDGATH